jgi:hypothetical protein
MDTADVIIGYPTVPTAGAEIRTGLDFHAGHFEWTSQDESPVSLHPTIGRHA